MNKKYDSIIVNGSSYSIKINSKGDEITINFDDRERVNQIIEIFENFKVRATKHLKEPELDSLNKMCEDTENDLKRIFGDDILIKIFDIEHPSLRLFLEFFGKFWKVISDLSDSRNKQTVDNLEKLYGDKYFNRVTKE